jgi:hypothetical protein
MHRTLTLALASALVAAVAGAQSATGNIRGYVTSGSAAAAVPDAQVVARALDNNAQRGTLTNASGFFYMGGLRPGRYVVSARRVGFSPTTRTITLQIGQTLDLNLPLTESAVTLSAVQVTADAQGLVIADNGTGFDPARAGRDLGDVAGASGASTGFGLMILAERAQMLGAGLTVDSAPGRGARLTLTWRGTHADSSADRR